MNKLIKQTLIATLVLYLFLTPALGQEASDLKLPSQKTYPGALTYQFKRVWEKMWEKLPGSKSEYYKQLTLTRLAELDYVAQNKHLGEIQTSNERFAYYAGKLTESVEGSEKTLRDEIKNDFNIYIKKLEDLQTNFEYGTSYWMLMEHSINSLRAYIEKLEK